MYAFVCAVLGIIMHLCVECMHLCVECSFCCTSYKSFAFHESCFGDRPTPSAPICYLFLWRLRWSISELSWVKAVFQNLVYICLWPSWSISYIPCLYYSWICFFFFLKTVSVCSPGWPETHHARLASNSQGSPCLCLLSSELIKGVGHHTQLDIFYLKWIT